MIIGKSAKEVYVGVLVNGMAVIGLYDHEKRMLQKAFAFEAHPDPTGKGIGFQTSPIVHPMFIKKAGALEGVPEMQTFVEAEVPRELMITLVCCEDIKMGPIFTNLYNDTWTKVQDKTPPPLKKDGQIIDAEVAK